MPTTQLMLVIARCVALLRLTVQKDDLKNVNTTSKMSYLFIWLTNDFEVFVSDKISSLLGTTT